MSTPDPQAKMIIQFDGYCILCSRTIQFILKADKKRKFNFQTLQSGSANTDAGESVRVNDGKRIFTHFDAVLKIGKELGGIYRVIEIVHILPRKWRFSLYNWVAEHRYRWFGKRESCFIPSPEEKKRFI